MIRTAFSLGALAILVIVGALIFAMTRGGETPDAQGEAVSALPEVGTPPRATPPLPLAPQDHLASTPDTLPPLQPQGQAGSLPAPTLPGGPLALPPLEAPGQASAEAVPAPAPLPAPVIEAPAAPEPDLSERTYTVQPGDSLWRISVRNYGSAKHLKAIAQANRLSDSSTIRPGQVLVLPALSGLREAPRDADHEAVQARSMPVREVLDEAENERLDPEPASRTAFQPMPPTL